MRFYRPWLPILSALLFQLSFPPVDFRLLVFVCLVPWFIFLSDCSKREAFRSGYTMGFLIVLAQMSWVIALISKWTGSGVLAVIPWILCGFLGAFYFAFAGVLIRSAFLRKWYWAPPLIWAGIEVGRSYIPGLAFPFFLLASPLSAYPALDSLSFFGTVYFVSAWVCLVNVWGFLYRERIRLWALSHIVSRVGLDSTGTSPIDAEIVAEMRAARNEAQHQWERGGRRLMEACGGLAVLFLAGSVAWYLRPDAGRAMRFTVGQPGFDLAYGDQSLKDSELSKRVSNLFADAKLAHSALLILPEGLSDSGAYPPDPPFDLPKDLPVLFGGQRGIGPAYQTAFLYDHGHWSYADKSRLVVFGEYVPGRDYLPFLKSFKVPSGDLVAAHKVTALRMGDLTIGPMLCFEGLFWDVAHKQSENGAQLLAIMSIDDWYMGTPAPEQLADAAIWRAIETGLPVLRSASTGQTMAIDARGRVIGRIPLRSAEALTVDVDIERNPLRNPLRPAFPWIAGCCPFFFVGYLMLSRRRAASGD